ncbi:T4 family baseplate hub assembly chaperone [Streptomyces antimycoticus]|uniref:T4 family baseplate hub assembly chaperone n=1 Tax=Streptomyces antimycoticus TaxID=68175 RepID=UPI0036821CD2
MGNTGPAELLAIWEAGLAHHGPGRALLLHRAARPESAADELLSLPVGEREADLYALRRALFGERMQIRAECGACGEAMEFDLDARDLGVRPRKRDGPLRVAEGEWTVEFRLPTVADLEAAAHAVAGAGGRAVAGAGGRAVAGAGAHAASGAGGAGDGLLSEDVGVGGSVAADGDEAAEAFMAAEGGDAVASTAAARARRALLARCLVSVHRAGQPVPADRLPVAELPEPVQRKLAEAAERADPAADVTLNVACPACGEATRAELDIASYLWAELDHWARDLLLDVHLLATAYGWSEPQILALSPLRRRYYLELCADG